jgi:integrase
VQPLSALEEKIAREEAYSNFINSIQSDATATIYRYALLRYVHFHGFKSTSEMITGDLEAIEKKILDFVKGTKVSKPTMSNYLSALKKFYRANRLKPDWEYIISFNNGRHRRHNDRPYTVEEIQRILDYCDLRTKALVLLLVSTGVRIGAVVEMKKRHLKAIDEYGLYQITVYEGAKEQYTTFCTPEAREAIDDWFAYRQRAGEILSPSSLVIRDKIDLSNPDKVKHPKAFTLNALKKLLYDLIVRAGVKDIRPLAEGEKFGKVRHDVQTAHGFRKFATSAMIQSNLNAVTVDKLLGHRTGLMHVYHLPKDSDLLVEYVKAVDALTINPKNRLQRQVAQLESEKDLLIRSLEKRLKNVEKSLLNRAEPDYEEQGDLIETDPLTNRLTKKGIKQLIESVKRWEEETLQKARNDP